MLKENFVNALKVLTGRLLTAEQIERANQAADQANDPERLHNWEIVERWSRKGDTIKYMLTEERVYMGTNVFTYPFEQPLRDSKLIVVREYTADGRLKGKWTRNSGQRNYYPPGRLWGSPPICSPPNY